MRAVLVGNYGVGNLGDEALREYFLASFPEVEWKVLSARPSRDEYARLPGGWRSFLGFRWIRTLRMMRTADAVVFGGGSLFTDVESPYACYLWGFHGWVASLLGKKIVLAFQGMGPYRTKRGEWIARKIVAKAAFISVRDEESGKRLEPWSKNTKVVQTFDPVFSLFLDKKPTKNTKNVFTIIPRKNSSETFLQEVSETIKNNNWEEVRVVLMEGEHQDEKGIANAIMSIAGGRGSTRSVHTIDELLHSLVDSSLAYTQRFHGALAALAMDIPQKVFSQGKGDKLSIVASILDQGEAGVARLTENIRAGEDALHAWFAAGR